MLVPAADSDCYQGLDLALNTTEKATRPALTYNEIKLPKLTLPFASVHQHELHDLGN